MNKGIDVTNEYIKKATPGVGTVSFDDGYIEDNHEDEINTAYWIIDTLGGDIMLLTEESGGYQIKRADYLWKDKYWELKSAGSARSIDSLLRKAIQQINENPGGVILNMGKSRDSMARIESAIGERVRKSCRFTMDVIIIRRESLDKVIRFIK